MARGLNREFFKDLESGFLNSVLAQVKSDTSLCLGLRGDSVNVYYRGGSLIRVSRKDGAYKARFDQKYFMDGTNLKLKASNLDEASLKDWLDNIPLLKYAMDRHLAKYCKEEREVQQLILRENNFGRIARSTDFYICDIEYANKHGRFDMVGVLWPSNPHVRKCQTGHRLVLMEAKFGDNTLGKSSKSTDHKKVAGLHDHIDDVNNFLKDPANLESLKNEMAGVFNQCRTLGLIDCGKDLKSFSDEKPMLLLVLANHDPGKSRLRELLRDLPECPNAEIGIASASLMGYGLFREAILSPKQALERI